MKLSIIMILITILLVPSTAYGLEMFSGNVVSIDTPINDDIFAAGNIVNINAPVNSATIVGAH